MSQVDLYGLGVHLPEDIPFLRFADWGEPMHILHTLIDAILLNPGLMRTYFSTAQPAEYRSPMTWTAQEALRAARSLSRAELEKRHVFEEVYSSFTGTKVIPPRRNPSVPVGSAEPQPLQGKAHAGTWHQTDSLPVFPGRRVPKLVQDLLEYIERRIGEKGDMPPPKTVAVPATVTT